MTINYLNKLKKLATINALPHAILLSGEDKSFEIAVDFAKWLFSQNNIRFDCHPDCLLLDLPREQEIKIDVIREINIFANSTPYLANKKIIIINHFHNINHQAANAFLKTLEEPLMTVNTVFLLISNHTKILPRTILSRVLQINIFNEHTHMEDSYSVLQDLYSLWVLEDNNVMAILEKWYNYEKHQLIDCLWFIVTNMLKPLKNLKLLQIKQKISEKVLWQLLDSLNYINRSIILGYQVNWQLFLDNFIFTSVIGENIYGRPRGS